MGTATKNGSKIKKGRARGLGWTQWSVEQLRPDELLEERRGKGSPSLRARGSKSGVPRFYLRYTDSRDNRVMLPIGAFERLADAEVAAAPLRARWLAGERDLREIIAAETEARERAKREAKEAAAARAAQDRRTLGLLCETYCDQLGAEGKISERDARSTLRRALQSSPLWTKPAAEVTGADLVTVINATIAAGHKREAAKVRSYLRAAYRRAASASLDPNSVALHVNLDNRPLLRCDTSSPTPLGCIAAG